MIILGKTSPSIYANQMESNFGNQAQRNMSITEGETKFIELIRFILEYIDTEKKRAVRF